MSFSFAATVGREKAKKKKNQEIRVLVLDQAGNIRKTVVNMSQQHKWKEAQNA